MKKLFYMLFGAALLSSCCQNKCCQNEAAQEPGLKEYTNKYFYLGTALNTDHIIGADIEGVKTTEKHFAAISPENCLKPEEVHPFEGVYEWTIPDAYVEFGQRNNMFIHGHTLVWHSQCPDWFFFDEKGDTASYDLLKQRLEEHITTIVGHYKGKIHSWDVINESVIEGGLQRQSMWYKILGDDLYEITFDGIKDFGYGYGNYTGNTDTSKTKRTPVAMIAWSPDSKHFATMKYDMRKLKELWVINSVSQPRPTLETYKYQMPGEPGPQEELYVFNMEDKSSRKYHTNAWKDQEMSI